MKEGNRPVIFGDGTQSRDFINVADVVEANLRALAYGRHGVFNIGTGKAATLNRVVELLNSELKTSISPVYEPNRIKNYVSHTLADTSLAAKELHFRSSIPLETGISRLVHGGQ